MSFVDLPWKALTVGIREAADAENKGEPQQRVPQRVERPERKDDVPGIFKLAVVVALLYPVCVFVTVAIAFFQICFGTSKGPFAVIGGFSLLATALYGVVLIGLNTQQEFRNVMLLTSPGFGWAVVFIGALTLTSSGMIHSDVRER